MPTFSSRLAIPLPLGNEANTRAARIAELQAIDNNAATLAEVRRPFYLNSAVYEAGPNRVTLSIGPGRAGFYGTMVNLTGNTTYYITSASSNTTYYLYVTSAGTFTHNTSGVAPANSSLIWTVATGSPVSVITTTDRRSELSELGSADATTTSKGIVELATNGESAANVVVQGNDGRLSDARTPTSHAANHISTGSDPIAAATTTVRGTVELATNGESAANVVVQGNDSRLSDARPPTAHATTHNSGGTDQIAHNNLAGLTTGDPHTQYQTRSEKGAANGYPSLGSDTIIPAAQLGTGSAGSGAKVLADNKTWITPSAGEVWTEWSSSATTPTSTTGSDGIQDFATVGNVNATKVEVSVNGLIKIEGIHYAHPGNGFANVIRFSSPYRPRAGDVVAVRQVNA